MDEERDTITLRSRRKKASPLNLTSCFQGHSDAQFSSPSSYTAPPSPHFLSPSWFRSKSTRGASNRGYDSIARSRGCVCPSRIGGRRRRHSADFSYDPLSYALNFDDGEDFSVRSPVSPPRRRIEDLELPVGRRSGALQGSDSAALSPTKSEVEKTPSPAATSPSEEIRSGGDNPTTATGRRVIREVSWAL